MATKMRIQKTKNDQYIVTIPKAFAEAFDFKQGTLMEFKIDKDGGILMRKVRR
ncbi:AbrB/MazE/SpoVT family DNA-binding domain-containing protein [Candidatus Woesearchaeota archaeon]|nr:AbrB/MazE/SpoVT family DNA-binding domain-containing protein [Candidatus Woesearchaeota archaeon]